MLQQHSMCLIACSATKLTEFVSTHVRVQRTFSISIRHFASITQAAAVITDAYAIVEDNWDSNFTSSNRHHLLTVKLKYAKVLNGSIIEEHFLPNTQWTCTGTMANGDYWTINTFNASVDDKRAAIVSLRSVPQYFAIDTVIVNNSMSDDITRFQCNFSKI